MEISEDVIAMPNDAATSSSRENAELKNTKVDDERNKSPETVKDKGVENPDKDENDITTNNSNEEGKFTETEKELQHEVVSEQFQEDGINVTETETEVCRFVVFFH